MPEMTREEFDQVEAEYVALNKVKLYPLDVLPEDEFALVTEGLYTADKATFRELQQKYPELVITRCTFDNKLPLSEMVGICIRDPYIMAHAARKRHERPSASGESHRFGVDYGRWR